MTPSIRGLGLVIAVMALLPRCRSADGLERPEGKLGVVEADRAIRTAVADWGAVMTADPLPLIEWRQAELWTRLGVQVFKVDPGSPVLGGATFILHDGEAHPIGGGEHHQSMLSLAVCDIDGDGRAELAYSYAWPDDLRRSEFAVWRPHADPADREVIARSVFVRGAVRVREQVGGALQLAVAPFREPDEWGEEQARLGTLEWRSRAPDPLRVVLDARLPSWARDRVWAR